MIFRSKTPTTHAFEAGPTETTLGEVAMKRCPKCGERKPLLTGFNRHAKSADGRQSYCITCARAAAKAAYHKPRTNTQPKEGKTFMSTTDTNGTTPKTRTTDKTSIWIGKDNYERLAWIKDTLGFETLNEATTFILDVATADSRALDVEKARREVQAAQDRLNALVAGTRKTTEPTLKTTTTGNGTLHKCSVHGCTRNARGGFKMCLYHRRRGREQQAERARRLKRQQTQQFASAQNELLIQT